MAKQHKFVRPSGKYKTRTLRADGARQAFLLKLSDALQPLNDADEVEATAMELLVEQLEVTQAGYFEFVGGRCKLADFRFEIMESYSAGGTLTIRDTETDRKHKDRRNAYRAAGIRAWAAVPLVKNDELLAVVGVYSAVPRAWTTHEIELVHEVAERTWGAIARVQAAIERFSRTIVEGLPQLVWRAKDGGDWIWASPQWSTYTGQVACASHGTGWMEPLHPDDRKRTLEQWRQAAQHGRFEANYRIFHAARSRYRWFLARALPVRNSAGGIVEWLGTATDVDDMHSLQERQTVLVSELQHRTFNLMGIVRSMADATVRSSISLEEFKSKFRDRIAALARVQRLLSRLRGDERVSFDGLIRGELEAVGALQQNNGRVHLHGPAGITIRTSAVQTLAMAIHELTTNAVKYGALNQTPHAKLEVGWRIESGIGNQPWLRVDWLETGVVISPPQVNAQGTGQGRSLIEAALSYQLRAEIIYLMETDGIRCYIKLPSSAWTFAESESRVLKMPERASS